MLLKMKSFLVFEMAQVLFNGELQPFKLNFGTITLLPKKEEAMRIENFSPICELRFSFNMFTNVGTNRLALISKMAFLAIDIEN